jgi:oligopeptide/dipeptide ABC transporter ATP-binding protein
MLTQTADSLVPVLDVSNLRIDFATDYGVFNVIDGISYSVYPGEILGIVGESGCGKTVSLLAAMGLLPRNAIVRTGEITFRGKSILRMKEPELRRMRGAEFSMIFQDPMKSLDPVYTVGDQISEALSEHRSVSKEKAKEASISILRQVDFPAPERIYRSYPHELSGGMKQRVMIAMGLICEPKLIIADEPTTALDVTIQAQILQLLRNINRERGTSIVLITHDLGVISEMCDRVAVMYAGHIVEVAEKRRLFERPKHPYTKGLLSSIPKIDESVDELSFIPGVVPSPLDFPKGCRFSTRCAQALSCCADTVPEICEADGSEVKCRLYRPDEPCSLRGQKANNIL